MVSVPPVGNWLNMTRSIHHKDKVVVIGRLWPESLNLLIFPSPKGQRV